MKQFLISTWESEGGYGRYVPWDIWAFYVDVRNFIRCVYKQMQSLDDDQMQMERIGVFLGGDTK